MSQRNLNLTTATAAKDWFSTAQLSSILLVVLVVFIVPSSSQHRQQQSIDLADYCTSTYLLLPAYLRVACESYLSRDLSPGNTDTTTNSGTSSGSGSGDSGRKSFFFPTKY